MIGLGRMGGNMVRRLLHGGHRCVVFDLAADRREELQAEGAQGAGSLEDLVRALRPPRAVWVMLPAGAPTENTIADLAERLAPGDTIIDGGNTYFRDDIRRARNLDARGIHPIDAGTSGGVWGQERGYCLMLGGDRDAVDRLAPIFETLAPEKGSLYCGPAGAGHFVKMVHNGIEYGLMQAYARDSSCSARPMAPLFRRTNDTSSTWRRSRSCGGTAASSRPGCWIWPRPRSRKIPTSPPIRGWSRIRARVAGPW
jgi:6-phosphogluconate dehydrogenase